MSLFDPFQAMSVGSPGPPLGWSFVSGGGIVTAGTNGGPFPLHNWFELNGVLSTPDFASGSAQSTLTLYFAFQLQRLGAVGPFIQVFGNAAGGGLQRIFTLKQEGDLTLSGYVAGSPDGFIANSTPFTAVLAPGSASRWYYGQLNLQITTTTIGLINWLTVTSTLAIDGATVFSGTGVSNFYADTNFVHLGANYIQYTGSDLGLGDPIVTGLRTVGSYPNGVWTITVTNGGTLYNPATTTVSFTGGGGGSQAAAHPVITPITGVITAILLDAGGLDYTAAPGVVITDSSGSGSGAAATAALAPAPFVRSSQMVNEIGTRPTTARVRVSQMVNEIGTKPNTANVRMAQMVIELATLNPPGRWYVYES